MFWNICFIGRRLPRRTLFCFTYPNSQSILHLLSLIPSIPAFSRIWVLIKRDCFHITCFSLHLSQGSKLLKCFFWGFNFSTLLYFQQTSVIVAEFLWYLKDDIPSLNNITIFCFSAILTSFSLLIFQHILWTKWKQLRLDFRALELD